ncbi:MAG: hypothetical protein ABJB09_02065 [Verrucomicrobiota bacterium]
MLSSLPRVYPLLGLCGSYLIVLFFNPIRLALRDGFRCITRFKRIWLTFALLGFAYSVFQFATFTPLQRPSDIDFTQVISPASWEWPDFADVWKETPLPALEGLAGIFDSATTTYPLSVLAALLLILNWRGLHGALFRALYKRFHLWGYVIYAVLVLSALAALLKPIAFWRLPEWGGAMPSAGLLQVSASVDALAFIFEYLFGVYIQVYLITVVLAWIKGLSFGEMDLFRFALRRFSYVLEWAGLVVIVSTLIVRLPLLLAYFRDVPNVLDYLPLQRIIMSGLIIMFCSVQVSLVLHNETLGAALRAHRQFLGRNVSRFAWFLIIGALHFFFLAACDAIVRGAVADRVVAFVLWKTIYVCARGYVTGWLLASWVCLFRQCENARANQETWIRY